MPVRSKSKATGRARGADRANEVRAAKRLDAEMSFRDANRPATQRDIDYGAELVRPLDWLWEHFDEEVSDADLRISALKLSRECAWVPHDDLSHENARSTASDGVLLLRAQDIVARGDAEPFIFGTPQERARRATINAQLSRIDQILMSAREQARIMGHNGAPAEVSPGEIVSELARLQMCIDGLKGQLRQQQANIAEVVSQALALQSVAASATRPAVSLGRLAAEKSAEAYGSTVGRAGALATLYAICELVPALNALIHLVVAWLLEVMPALG